jgi:glycosyltransferase involved in cell wall biosynthesis
MSGTRVSVVIPCYNGAHFLHDTIASVLAQTHMAHEIIIVDDGSTDDTAEVARSYTNRGPVIVISRPNTGLARARNDGIQRATGEFVALLDADDGWHPRKLELQLAAWKTHPEVGLVASNLYEFPGDPPQIPNTAADEIQFIKYEDAIVGCQLAPSSVILSRKVIEMVGYFDPNLRHGGEDWDYYIRVSRFGPIALLLSQLTGFRGDNPGSMSKNARRMKAGFRYVLKKQGREGAWRRHPYLRRKAYASYHEFCAFLFASYGTWTQRPEGLWHIGLLFYYNPFTRLDRYRYRIRLLIGLMYNFLRGK